VATHAGHEAAAHCLWPAVGKNTPAERIAARFGACEDDAVLALF